MPTTGAVTVDSGPLALTISYDATTQAYTVSDGVRSQTFEPGDFDPGKSSATLTTYTITSGNTTESLSLTKTGTGAGQTRYVAAGFWQRQVNGATSVDGRFEAFAYGIRTPDGALPRTGFASFDVSLLGAESFGALVYALAGSGRVNASLESGAIIGAGTYSKTNVATGAAEAGHVWGFAAFLSANSNNFDGQIALTSVAGRGELHGAFFGPAANEVGASFSYDNNSDRAAAGTIIGVRNSTRLNQSTSLITPQNDTFFTPLGVSLRGSLDAQGRLSTVVTNPGLLAIHMRSSAPGQFQYFSRDGRASDILPDGYNERGIRIFSGGGSGAAGTIFDTRPNRGYLDAFVFGFDTSAAGVPRTGTAQYAVTLLGGVMAPGATPQSLEGKGAFGVNFATGAVGTLGTYTVTSARPVLDVHSSGTMTDGGRWSGTGTLSSTANAFSGTFEMDGTTDYSGSLIGKFFGTNAAEVGAVANLTAASGARAVAALTGARGVGEIPDLTVTTTLQGSDAQFNTRPSQNPTQSTVLNPGIQIAYDPAAKSYTFVSPATSAAGAVPLNNSLTQANRTGGDATFTNYQATGYSGRTFNVGAGNPVIVLSYTSFAEIIEDRTVGGVATNSHHYIAFGAQTPAFQVPTTGTASYSGVVYGTGRHGLVSNEAALSGTSSFSVNFATNAASMLLDLTATDKASGVAQDLADLTFTGTLSAANRSAFVLTTPAANNGTMNGQFNGPDAAEFAASFRFDLPPTVPGNAASGSTFAGVTVGKKD